MFFFHHGTHIHPFLGPIAGSVGDFTIPQTGETSADTFYEIKFTATDSNNLTSTKSIIINPRKSHFTIATEPPGVGLELDGIPMNTPQTFEGVVGFKRELNAPILKTVGGKNYHFKNWSDGGVPRHTITTPETDTTYTAFYQEAASFTGQYFSNMNLSGSPTLTRQDPNINFIWNNGSPHPSIPNDRFSVRWTSKQHFPQGKYKFTTTVDDGVRLYIDNQLVIDKWIDQPSTTYSTIVDLSSGDHDIKMEYFENGGGAIAKLTWDVTSEDPLPQPTGDYVAQYFDNMTLSGSPKLQRNEPAINFDWGNLSPDPNIPSDRFSARFTRTINLTAGSYEFTTTADDGVRLYLDNELILDKWIDQPSTTYKVTKNLTSGDHTIKLEYYENGGGAIIKMNYQQVSTQPPPTSGYQAGYWNVPGTGSKPTIPTTSPTLSRVDPEIDFFWDQGSPDPSITPDHFVARWTARKTFEGTNYRFTTESDDGIRVYIDNQLILDQWNDHALSTFEVEKQMTAGEHDIKVEYYENGGGAIAKFSYQKTTASTGTFLAEFFNNMTLSGTPTVTRNENAINFTWNSGSPDPAIPADFFSARFTKTMNFIAGNYEFTVTADDGVRLFIDNVLVLDKWIDQPATTYKVNRALTSGDHTIRIEYYERGGGAIIKFLEKLL